MEKQSLNKRLKIQLIKYPQLGALSILIVVIIVFTILSPVNNGINAFISTANIKSVLEQTAGISIVAFGMTMVLLVGGPDLSVSATIALSGVVTANLMEKAGWGIAPSIIASLLMGLLIGFINGFIIVRYKVLPYLVTMGMQIVARGACYALSKGETTYIMNKKVSQIFVRSNILGVPVIILWTLFFLVSMYVIVSKTKLGRWTQGIGGNELAARNSGINVGRIKIAVFMLNGFLAAFAGLITLSRLGAGMPSVGIGAEGNAIAAAVIGGTSFSGDGGNMFGTLLGSLVMGSIVNGLTIIGMNSYVQDMVRGSVILISVIGSSLLVSRKNKK